MKKIKDIVEYFIYNDDELVDVISFTKKEKLVYQKQFPNYILEPTDIIDCTYDEN